jgi:hypothetical protein
MVPSVSHPALRELIVGTKEISTTKFGFNLLLTNNRIQYKKNPTEATIKQLAEQTHDFLTRYESLYQSELKQIFSGDYRA